MGWWLGRHRSIGTRLFVGYIDGDVQQSRTNFALEGTDFRAVPGSLVVFLCACRGELVFPKIYFAHWWFPWVFMRVSGIHVYDPYYTRRAHSHVVHPYHARMLSNVWLANMETTLGVYTSVGTCLHHMDDIFKGGMRDFVL